MRNSPILSAPPAAKAKTQTALLPENVAAFNVCQVGVVLRLVLFVELLLAVAAMFVTVTPIEWLTSLAVLTGGGLPATLLWLVVVCALKRLLAHASPRGQQITGAVMGALCGLYGCAMLYFTNMAQAVPWLGSAMAGLLLGWLVMALLLLRARGQAPAFTAARLSELQSRIRPHFLFNTLNSAIALVRKEPAKAEAMLEDLSELFHHALADARESVTLADEIELAKRYLAIEQIRFGDRLRIRWNLDEEANEARLPPLLLQPLVENAVKHGVEPSPKGGKLYIHTQRRGSRVLLEVINTLPPLMWADKPLPRGHGIALDNVRDRMSLLYDMQAHIRVGMSRDRYRVQIEFPAL